MRNAIWLVGLGLLVTGASPCGGGNEGGGEPGGGTIGGRECGDAVCAVGQVCCNESCGICTPPGGLCTQQFCGDPDPSPGAPPSCGGIAGLDCPGSGLCEDDPGDACDPENGGADCGGLCSCNVLGLCVDGMEWDDDPSVCGCVRGDGGGGNAGSGGGGDRVPCGPNVCDAGEVCCNESCGICTPPDGACTEQFCGDPDPGPEPDPGSPRCGGIAGLDCPGAGRCVDDPSDDCDPNAGGADCGGLCTCSAAAVSCLAGVPFDDSPEVCACVEDGGGDGVACGPTRCARGEVCCNESCGICTPPDGACTDQICDDPGPGPGELCDMSCEPGNHCELVEVVCIRAPCNPVPECVPNVQCGGFAGFTCPGAGECIDDPNDDCDPNDGGADCGGFCTCSGALILCAPDTRLDTSPEVCECVRADGGGGEQCGSNTCPDGQVCCNASCGICTPPDGACIQIACL